MDDTHAGVQEISTISRGDSQTVDKRSGRQQFRPFKPGLRVPGETVEPSDTFIEPAFQRCSLSSAGQDENPEWQFARNHGIDSDIRLMQAKPCHDPRIGRWFRRLAQNVGVDRELHNESVG